MMRMNFVRLVGKVLPKTFFFTFATNFWTEAPALEHHFWNCSWPN
jgi:hypothetical protein